MMQRSVLFCLATLGLGAVGAGCETVDSTDVETSGVYANISVMATGTGESDVQVSLRVGGAGSNTYLDLQESDSLFCAVNGERRELARSQNSLTGAITYHGTLPSDESGAEFTISFERDEDHEDAPSSVASLPEPFALTAPAASTNHSRTEDLVIEYAPAVPGEQLSYVLSGDCINTSTRQTPELDSGMVVVERASLMPKTGMEAASCEVTLSLMRSAEGTVDPAYDGGSVVARQVRNVKINLTP